MRCALTLALVTVASVAHAQSERPYSIQAAGLLTSLKLGRTGNIGGAGFEVQGRYTPLSKLSYGVGVQYSTHSSFNPGLNSDDKLTLSGVFVEPRYAVPLTAARVGVYLAGRLAGLRQTNNFGSSSSGWAVGAGAGVLFHLNQRVDLDGGGAVIRQSLGDVTLNSGGAATFPSFTGYVAKLGLNVGFGTRKL
ncbi:hypothetical protein J421_6327 (plasmid) [Gemmatirosa kalamazoonensis]|jgi:hypothetical protein|uniref:Outer membrane protein beta-barrel domain-containing protein n=1 Tax=Gemmatirosa kalamazoonensis TaxID=861299 RepID=W0RTS3_9BACT|nr:hypothetical protein J421_6327 [Gemmatirosa kalamazoonensis]